MKTGVLLVRLTAIVIFVQLVLGGLLTFNFITPGIHIAVGILVLVLAIATMVSVLVSKQTFKPLRNLSIGLVALIVVQLILGFVTLKNGSAVIAWIHFVTALGIYGMSVASNFFAMQWNRINGPPMIQQEKGRAPT
jgi:hypothetical protein